MSNFRKQHNYSNWQDLVDVQSKVMALEAPLSEKASVVSRMGSMMMAFGNGAWRVRALINKVSKSLGIITDCDIGLVSLNYMCINKDETFSGTISLAQTGVNTHKLAALDKFADSLPEKIDNMTIVQLHKMLDKINSIPLNYNSFVSALAAGLACSCFAFLLGGNIFEILYTFFGAFTGQFVRRKLMKHNITLVVNVTLSVAAAGLVYFCASKLAGLLFNVSSIYEIGYTYSMLFVIPGFPLITSIFDIAKLDLRSGVERITYSIFIILMATLTGWLCASAFSVVPGDVESFKFPEELRFILRLAASFGGVFGFSLMFNSRIPMALTAGAMGMISNTLRLELVSCFDCNFAIAAFIGALTSGLMASAIKQFIGYPRINVTVPSIVIMVPGLFLYKGMYFSVLHDFTQSLNWLMNAFLVVSSISLGLIFARIITDKNFRKVS